MALKADMRVILENVRYKSDAAIRAGSAVIKAGTQPTNAGVGQAINGRSEVVANYTGAPPSGTICLGVALVDVINYDPTLVPRSVLRPTQQFVGENVLVGEIAEVWTNEITGTPTINTPAYLAAGSTFGTTSVNSNPAVGTWMSTKDSGGYALLLVRVV